MNVLPDRIVLRARGEGDGGLVGDFIEDVLPDSKLPGKVTYDILRELGDGGIEIADDWNSARAVDR